MPRRLDLSGQANSEQRAEVGRQRSEATKSSGFPLRIRRAKNRFDIPTDRATKEHRSAGRSIIRLGSLHLEFAPIRVIRGKTV
jgi:hypothetical protein